jgi:quinol monooxygenase YgiN
MDREDVGRDLDQEYREVLRELFEDTKHPAGKRRYQLSRKECQAIYSFAYGLDEQSDTA